MNDLLLNPFSPEGRATLGTWGVCPNVKRSRTRRWVAFSGGWCFLLLALLHTVIDMTHLRTRAFPLVVFGMNSIAACCMDHLFGGFISDALHTHLPTALFGPLGDPTESFVRGALVRLIL
ncbi:MAG TPA: hypothetical protein VNO52_10815 [Methylomirabilota bacterium]|nr:hypothetical protein [Methylomirabilota bacterium]